MNVAIEAIYWSLEMVLVNVFIAKRVQNYYNITTKVCKSQQIFIKEA